MNLLSVSALFRRCRGEWGVSCRCPHHHRRLTRVCEVGPSLAAASAGGGLTWRVFRGARLVCGVESVSLASSVPRMCPSARVVSGRARRASQPRLAVPTPSRAQPLIRPLRRARRRCCRRAPRPTNGGRARGRRSRGGLRLRRSSGRTGVCEGGERGRRGAVVVAHLAVLKEHTHKPGSSIFCRRALGACSLLLLLWPETRALAWLAHI